MKDNITVFDVGGSIVAPNGPDVKYLKSFVNFLKQWLNEDCSRRIIIVIGGGSAARKWQATAKSLAPQTSVSDLDWIGIMATRLNAELLRTLMVPLCTDSVVIDPSGDFNFTGRVLVAAGWKPGFSTDFDTVVLAERYSVRKIIMLTNIEQVYDSDPKVNTSTKAIPRMTWSDYKKMCVSDWIPGANIPFDPVATARASETGLTLIAVSGRNLKNLEALLSGYPFIGTEIVPDSI